VHSTDIHVVGDDELLDFDSFHDFRIAILRILLDEMILYC